MGCSVDGGVGGTAIVVDASGNAYVTGGNYGRSKYDSDGQEQWVARYVGDK